MSSQLLFTENAVSPGTPTPGKLALYAKTDGFLYFKNDAGTEIVISSTANITSLTGDVTATGPGAAAATVQFVGGQTAANVASATIEVLAATSSNTPSTLVFRDGSGNFSAGVITASLSGNATTATTATNFSGSLSGDVTGTQSATVVALVGGSTAANVHSAELLANAATAVNTASTIVRRDGSGNFAATTITANLTGNVSGTAANVTGIVAIANGGTNSSTTLNNNRVMISSGGSIVEEAAITGNRALASNASGLPVASVTTDTELGYVSGVTSSIQTQLNAKASSSLATESIFVGDGSNVATATDTSAQGHILADTATGLTIKNNVITNAQVNASAAIAYSKLNLSNSIVNADINTAAAIAYSKLVLTNSIVNADVNSTAAIAYSKLNLTASIVNADIAAGAAIAYSKLALTNSIVNADINASAAIAYSKLNLTASIVNADINASAAIAYSKLNLSTSIVSGDLNAAIYGTPVTQTPDQANASGVLTTLARADHIHDIPSGPVVQIGTANFQGAAASFALSDHVHSHGAQTNGTLHAVATTSVNGFMSSTDKTKLDSISGTVGTNTQILISDGTTYNPRTVSGDLTNTNTGSFTVVTVGTSSSANIHSAELAANAATSANTPNTIVKRDGSGNFSAGVITASLTGNVTGNVSGSAASFTGSLVGDVTGTQGATVVSLVGGSSAANVHSAELAANAATSANTPNTIVKRDGSGNFSAGTITASLTGNATNVTGIVAVVNGGTGASTAPAARVNLNIDERSTFSNANYTVLSTDRYVAQIGTMSAPRTVTLPAANSVNAGQSLYIADESGSVTTTNTLTITAAGTDTINGSASKAVRSAFGYINLISNGSTEWFTGVERIGGGGTGLSTIPTDGQLLIGNSTNSNYVLTTLTAGTGIAITNAGGSITIASNATAAQVTKTANYTILSTDSTIFVDSSGGAFNLTLPDPSTIAGKIFRVIDTTGNLAADNVTLVRHASEKIEGLAASRILQTNWGWFQITTNGTDWFLG